MIDISVAYELDLEDIDCDTDEEGYPGYSGLEEIQLNGGRWYGPFNSFDYGDSEVVH